MDQIPVVIDIAGVSLDAFLGVPGHARGLIIFAHGSGSGRFSPRNNRVAQELRRAGFATLLLDLLTAAEERDRANVFDIDLLARRLVAAARWAQSRDDTRGLAVGLFGASTGGGAALVAAALAPQMVAAVVSRGGRPDLAGKALSAVRAPTLLVVGGDDGPVITMNQEAYQRLECAKEMVIIPGAGHLFEEAGTLDQVIGHAIRFFGAHLKVPSEASR